METLEALLNRGRNGNAILFCGAGFTADCLNFDEEETLGVTFHLLKILNDELKSKGKLNGFKDIKNAAKQFRKDIGDRYLMDLIKSRFILKNISASISDIIQYPWSAIYTTNYDNGLEIAHQNIGVKYYSINNTDDVNINQKGTPIIHLHGFAGAWSYKNFDQSCILDSGSYYNLPNVKKWLERLRFDIERAEIVIFIGFSAADFHLGQVFFNASGLREKAYFINRPSAAPPPDERATQEEFGTPLYISREEYANIITNIMKSDTPIEPKLSSFEKYQIQKPSESIPSVQDIEDLFIWGKIIPAHVKRDIDLSKSDYHAIRKEIYQIKDCISEEKKIVLLHGDICEGKSILILDLKHALGGSRPIFELHHSYDDVVDEVAAILTAYPNALFIIENCFSLREERLLGIARQISSSDGALILTARNVSTEAESSKIKGLRGLPSIKEVGVGKLNKLEIEALVDLIDQIAGWRSFRSLSPKERHRFIEIECNGIIPNILLNLLNSEYVRNKYREEYNKIGHINPADRQMIIAALLISNIGFAPPTTLISDIFGKDFSTVLNNIAKQGTGLKLLRAEKHLVKTIPSIGARNILKNIIDEREIVNTNIIVLERMSERSRRGDFEQHTFSQLMRYSILESIVSDSSEINRFFDHISKIEYFRTMPLFWLQWHMAMCAQSRWVKADEYLEMGYTAAAAYEKRNGKKYNNKQLDDRQAKFLAARASATMLSETDLFRDLKKSLDIVNRLMRSSDPTHHPYETLLDIAKVLRFREGMISAHLGELILKQMSATISQAKKKLDKVPEGYQRNHALASLSEVEMMV